MYEKIENAVEMVNREYIQDFCISKESRTSVLYKMVDYLDDYCRENSIVSVHGRGKRKSIHQRYLELFQRFPDRQLLYDLHHSRFGSRNSYPKTDVNATFMHMKEDHMRNAQLKPGYNVQIGVESEAAYDHLEQQNQIPYIKPQTYEKWKKRSFKQDISKRENMGYDTENDTYTCHAGRTLLPLYVKKQKSRNGYGSEVTVYECTDCKGCLRKGKCTKAKGNKRLYVSKNFIKHRKISHENIMSETGINTVSTVPFR